MSQILINGVPQSGGGGGGSGDVVSNAPILAGAIVTPVNALGGTAIDTTKSNNSITFTGNTSLSISSIPAASDTLSVLRVWNNSASPSVITLPGSPAWYSETQQANITAFTLPAGWRGRLGWAFDGTRFLLSGEPLTAAQVWTIQNVATLTIPALNIDWSASPSQSKTLSANSTFTFSNDTDGQTINVGITNTASNYTVTWPAGIKWSAGVAPVQTVGAKTDIYTFTKQGGIIYGDVSPDHY